MFLQSLFSPLPFPCIRPLRRMTAFMRSTTAVRAGGAAFKANTADVDVVASAVIVAMDRSAGAEGSVAIEAGAKAVRVAVAVVGFVDLAAGVATALRHREVVSEVGGSGPKYGWHVLQSSAIA